MVKLFGEKSQRAIAFVLRFGSQTSAMLMALGLVLFLLRGAGSPSSATGIQFGLLFQQLLRFDPRAVAELGLLVLLITPVVSIIVAAVSFALEGEYKYFFISLGVLSVVVLSMGFAVR